MLETIREYAAEQLAASPADESETRARHAEYYQDLAEASRDVVTNPRRDELLDRLDRELPNFRAAIAWSLEDGASGDRSPDRRCPQGLLECAQPPDRSSASAR